MTFSGSHRSSSSWLRILTAGAALCVPCTAARAEVASSSATSAGYSALAAEKSSFTLFHPTPPELRRALSTDRPTRTDSPYTVDAGQVQIETGLYSYTSEREGGVNRVEVDAFTLGGISAKVGLTNRLDLELLFDSYTSVRTKNRRDRSRTVQRGFGDVTARLKYNLRGNDGGTLAFALLPFLTFPTSEDDLGTDGLEGGLIAPLALKLPGGLELGAMTQLDLRRDRGGSGGHVEFVNSISLSRRLRGPVSGYAELFNNDNKESGAEAVSTLDLGLTYAVGENLQFDAGVNIGLNRAADDANPFFGFSRRF